ncbi:hypothetical protein ABBQ38_007780 [Trebouxia sp. C0009 RCD-2024]
MQLTAAELCAACSGPCRAHNQVLPSRCQQPQQRNFGHAVSRTVSQTTRARHRRATVSCTAGRQWETGCKLAGCGSSVPEAVLSNKDLEQLVETNDEWIATRTGIRKRHILGKHETLSDHAAKASQQALDMAGIAAEDVDLIILATSSPDDLFGSACKVQSIIGAKNATAYDITAACSGFVVALISAATYIRTGLYRNIIIIGADALSRYTDWRDRSTCILFGDGTGAMVLTAQQGQCALLGMDSHSDGAGQKHLNCYFSQEGLKPLNPEGASAEGSFTNIVMSGQDVFRFAVRAVPATLQAAMKDADVTTEQLDWLVLHQANQRILDAAAQRVGISSERVISNLAEYGNTSAASIPLAFDEAVRGGKIKSGDTVSCKSA